MESHHALKLMEFYLNLANSMHTESIIVEKHNFIVSWNN